MDVERTPGGDGKSDTEFGKIILGDKAGVFAGKTLEQALLVIGAVLTHLNGGPFLKQDESQQ